MRPATVVLLLLVPILSGCTGGSARACAAPALGSPRVAAPDVENVTFMTGDGVELHGSLWTVHPDHALVLIHGLGENRHSWDALAAELARRGFTVLTFDLRGHGESTLRRGEAYRVANFTPDDFLAMDQDTPAAIEVLRGRHDPPCLGLVGASVGANLALRAAVAKTDQVAALGLLSAGFDYHGILTTDVVKKIGGKPTFIAAARGDEYPYESSRRLAAELAAKTEVFVAGHSHGTNLLHEGPVREGLLTWLGNTL